MAVLQKSHKTNRPAPLHDSSFSYVSCNMQPIQLVMVVVVIFLWSRAKNLKCATITTFTYFQLISLATWHQHHALLSWAQQGIQSVPNYPTLRRWRGVEQGMERQGKRMRGWQGTNNWNKKQDEVDNEGQQCKKETTWGGGGTKTEGTGVGENKRVMKGRRKETKELDL